MPSDPPPVPARVVLVLSIAFVLTVRVPLPADEPPKPDSKEPASQKAGGVSAEHARRQQEGLKLFKEQIRPILVKQCLRCHGGKRVDGDVNLATRELLFDSGMMGEDAESSQLYAVIAHESEPHMPKDGEKLSEAALSAFRQWIANEAPYDRPLTDQPAKGPPKRQLTEAERNYWAFRPLQPVAPPRLENPDQIRTPIDAFILARQRDAGVAINPEADRRTLIRRAYFDLLGLPPTAEAVEAFVADDDPLAYEKLIDELLRSPHYGERWARHWMDVARFAESHGYEQDYDRKTAYVYRDFLIRAFNEDMPYDRFVRWQLAGDELAPDNPMAWAATGFLEACAFPTQLTEAEFESARYNELDDMVSTIGGAMLGLSLGCARCHDHKYDPVFIPDYFRLAANFSTAIRTEVTMDFYGDGKPIPMLVTSEGLKPEKHHADARGFPHFYPQTYILIRGDVAQKKEVAEPGYLPVLMRGGKDVDYWRRPAPPGAKTRHDRAGVARWMTDVQYGAGNLLARVMVNRLWQHHFGEGIVRTPNDFGLQGARPTHPQLLEYLAVDLVHHGWKLKRLHRLIMTSAVYRQSSAWDERRASVDRENRLWWRFPARRLEAEAVRDSLLALSGRLDRTLYGPGSLDVTRPRRSIYLFIKRSKLVPMMMLFDWPEHLVSIGRRSRTTTAPQALFLMNHPLTRACAEALARRIDGDVDTVVTGGFRLAYQRRPSSDERVKAVAFLRAQAQRYREEGRNDKEAARRARVDWCQMLLASHECLYIE